MPFTAPTPFTPERIRLATGDAILAERAQRALDAVRAADIDPRKQPLDWGFAFASDESASKYYEPEPGQTVTMESVAQLLMLLAAVTDPDGGAPAVFFDEEVNEPLLERRVNLANAAGWVDRNYQGCFGGSNIAAAMERLIQLIADERQLPALSALATLAASMDTLDGAVAPTVAMNPYVVALVVKDPPNDFAHLHSVLLATANTPIHWIIVSLDATSACEEAVNYEEAVKGRGNVTYVAFPPELNDHTEAGVLTRLTAELGAWHTVQVLRGLVSGA
jgi:hypothetical protein